MTIRSPYATRLGPFNSASNALSNGPRRVACGDPMAICDTITRGCHGWYVVVVGVVVVGCGWFTSCRASSEHTSVSTPVFHLLFFAREVILYTNSYIRRKLAGISRNLIRGPFCVSRDGNLSFVDGICMDLGTMMFCWRFTGVLPIFSTAFFGLKVTFSSVAAEKMTEGRCPDLQDSSGLCTAIPGPMLFLKLWVLGNDFSASAVGHIGDSWWYKM